MTISGLILVALFMWMSAPRQMKTAHFYFSLLIIGMGVTAAASL